MYAAGAGYIPAAQARILRIRGCGFRARVWHLVEGGRGNLLPKCKS